ncbi:unnamed protein product [Rotaria socialis]|uniref:Uncharacterized protein n=2 Tax=Rotaria socialis TaxID=392032 RepID=A0A820DD24_9BILA|nr:unnamed protein product [Rotaria socialis]CAF4230171.1 unnamed protein product [Rotaria socialis]
MTSSANPNPSSRAGRWSRFVHSWISLLLKKSYKQGTLHLHDLYDLLPALESTNLTEKLEVNWLNEVKHSNGKPNLIRATFKSIGWGPLLIGLLLIPTELTKFAQPILLTLLMGYFDLCPTISTPHAWILAVATSIAALTNSLIYHKYFYRITIYSVQLRVAYSGLIFRKILRLSSHSMNNLSTGQITNLVSNDANQAEFVLYFFHYLWVAPLELALVIIFFWQHVRYIAFIAVGYTLLLLIVQASFGRLFVYLRTRILQVTDERVKIMSEIIKSMRIVKMYCWETAFIHKICSVRKREIIRCAFRLFLDCIQTLLSHTYISVTFLMMYGTMWSLGIHFDTRFFAVASCMLGYMRLSIIDFFTFAVRHLVHFLAAKKRIQTFLLLDESERDNRLLSISMMDIVSNRHIEGQEILDAKPTIVKSIKTPPRVLCNLEQARWDPTGTFSLKNIVFDAHPGDLICVIGPVGAGKSSLLQTLTGEIATFDGKVRLYGSFCYVPQEPWIFSSSIKNNILFGNAYDPKLFQRVISVTALDSDLKDLSHGINTLVGDQGIMLSGGQKARVNLARALYRDADIYLLDDPLSAVDVKVSKHIFDQSIKNYLHDKICILVTHQIQFLQDATKIIVLNQGEMVEMGTYEELISTSTSFARLLEDINQHEHEQEIENETVTVIKRLSEVNSMISENGNQEDDGKPLPTNIETKQEGIVKWNVYLSYIRAGIGLTLGLTIMLVVYCGQQAFALTSNWWLAEWSNDEGHRHRAYDNCTIANYPKVDRIHSMSENEWNEHRNQRFYIFCGIVVGLFSVTLLRVVITEFICLNAGRILHDKMFQRLIRCPIHFFDMNPIGRILNRFTKDVATMDDNLPLTVFDFLNCLFLVFGTIALVGILNPFSFIPAVLAAIAMLLLRARFAHCLRDLKRIEGVTRSPVYSQLSSTINGLKVIRSYHAEQICSREFLHNLDDNTRVNYLLLTIHRWAGIRFDWISLSFIVAVTLLAMLARFTQQKFSASDVALTLSYSLNLMGLMQWSIRQSVELETQMTSIERVLEYCLLEQEPPAQAPPKYRPSANWPSRGQIIFKNVSMSHSNESNSSVVLDNICLNIQAGEKIGIVGRTGAGKSSFIQTIFRMGTLVNGQILIDNIDISTVGLDDVRRRISIIPQDPILFTGTMRSNLDRFGDYSDAEIWSALEQVQLKKVVSDVMSNGLHSLISESGLNLSVGQKQLVCLARAILKKNKILVIDEATANVDNATDELIQRAIREQFKNCTVLTVAHRLRTVIDSDRIMVLSHGKLLEFDSPYALLRNSESEFTSLIDQTGAAESDHLRELAHLAALKANFNNQNFNDNNDLPSEEEETDLLMK